MSILLTNWYTQDPTATTTVIAEEVTTEDIVKVILIRFFTPSLKIAIHSILLLYFIQNKEGVIFFLYINLIRPNSTDFLQQIKSEAYYHVLYPVL